MAEDAGRLDRWRALIAGPLRDEVLRASLYRQLFREVDTAIMETAPKDAQWLVHYRGLYLRDASMTVRRMVDKDPRTHSLTNLLTEMRHHPRLITLDGFLAETSESDAADREADRRSFLVGRGDDNGLDPNRISSDKKVLLKATKVVATYATKVFAHHEADITDVPVPTWGQLDSAIDVMANMWAVYLQVITGVGSEVDVYVPPTWRDVFARPLFPL